MHITFEDAPDHASHQARFEQIEPFDDSAIGMADVSRPLSLMLRDPQGRAEYYPAGHTRHFFTRRLTEGQACR